MMLLIIVTFLFQMALSQPSLTLHQTKLFGNMSLGYYYIFLQLGTPPQKQSLIVDTGSSMFAVPCQQCTSCGSMHISPKFNTNQSTTSKQLTCSTGQGLCQNCGKQQSNSSCKFSQYYVQGSSLEGYMIQDVVAFPLQDQKHSNSSQVNQEKITTVFSCITKQTNLFLQQKADGILGLAPTSQFNYVNQLYRYHYPFTKQNNSFSICFSINGGAFTAGGFNKQLHTNTNGINVRFRKDTNVYSVNISGINIGNTPLNLTESQIHSGYGVFIDSGATFSFFTYSHYNFTLRILEDVCLSLGCQSYAGRDSRCFKFPKVESATLDEQINRFPNITLKVNKNQSIEWTPYRYFTIKSIHNREVCLAFSSLDRFILGASWMIDRDIYFDLNREEIIIFQANCNYKDSTQKEQTTNQPTSLDKTRQIENVDHKIEGKSKYDQKISQVQQQIDAEDFAWMVSLLIIISFVIAIIVLIFSCKNRMRKQIVETTTITIVNEPPSEEYHDQISMSDIAEPQDSSRNI